MILASESFSGIKLPSDVHITHANACQLLSTVCQIAGRMLKCIYRFDNVLDVKYKLFIFNILNPFISYLRVQISKSNFYFGSDFGMVLGGTSGNGKTTLISIKYRERTPSIVSA